MCDTHNVVKKIDCDELRYVLADNLLVPSKLRLCQYLLSRMKVAHNIGGYTYSLTEKKIYLPT